MTIRNWCKSRRLTIPIGIKTLKNKFSLIYNKKTQFLPLREHAVPVTETRRLTVFKETVSVGCTIHKKHIGYMCYVGKNVGFNFKPIFTYTVQ